MRSHLLRTFLAVARSGNVTQAAARVHRAQSSVSDQLQILEAELGARLFRRSTTGLTLTSAGRALQPYAEQILALADEASAAVAAAAGCEGGSLTAGALETIACARMPQWLSGLRSADPGIRVQVRIGGSRDLLQQLADGEIDIVFCFDRDDLDGRLLKRGISMEPLTLVSAPHRSPVWTGDLQTLATQPFLATRPGCVYRHLFDKAFASAGVTVPRPVAEVDSIRTIVSLAAAGTGMALVPRLAVLDALERGDVVDLPWPGPVHSVPLVAIWRRRRVQPPALRQLLGATGLHLRGLTTPSDTDAAC